MPSPSPAVVTFDDIKVMLSGEHESALLKQLDTFTGAGIVLGAAATGSPALLTLLGPKNELVKIGDRLIGWFTNRKAPGAVERFERLSAAHELLVYSAFFSAAHEVLKRFDRLFELQPEERDVLVARSEDNGGVPAPVGLPHPAEGWDGTLRAVDHLYASMTRNLAMMLATFAGWDDPGGAVAGLPNRARKTYQAQYIALAAKVPEFGVWASIRRGEATRERFDVGFRALANRIDRLPMLAGAEQVDRVVRALRTTYTTAIEEPILKPDGDREYPRKCDIFVPQAYKTLLGDGSSRLEDEDRWEQQPVEEDLPGFLLRYLDSPYSLQTPLMILGLPGSGKSLLTQMLSARLATRHFNPVRIELRDVEAERDFQKLIEEQIRVDTGLSVQWPDLSEQMADAPPVVILDGFDELLQASGRAYPDFLEKVHAFQQREARLGRPVRVIVTSRITLIDKALVPSGATVLRLLDFDRTRRERWAEIWNQHNAQRFREAGIERFRLPAQPAVAELAQQPLLLLMLALYDSNANELHQRRDLDRTLLYDDLLRRFIRREREKAGTAAWAALAEGEREALIEEDMQRLRTVALGMYNRRSLHILSDHLDQDIDFLGVPREIPTGSGRELRQADLVLGSFFFVHQSDSGAGAGTAAGRVGDSAFEFLHTTFGEFLMADFLLHAALGEAAGVVAMQATPDLRARCERDLAEGTMPKDWLAGLAYAPLWERPVILTMISEWVHHLVELRGLEPKRLEDALDAIVTAQLRLLLDGTEPMAFTPTSPYGVLPLTGHYAVYSMNLVLLRTYAGVRDWKLARRWWERLGGLWRSWLTSDDLSRLTSRLSTEADGETVTIEARSRPTGTPDSLLEIYETAVVLQDTALAGLAGLHLADTAVGAIDNFLNSVEQHFGTVGSLRRELSLPILLRRVRERGWALTSEEFQELGTHAVNVLSFGARSRSERQLATLLAQNDAPAELLRTALHEGGPVSEAFALLEPEDVHAVLEVARRDAAVLRGTLSMIVESDAWRQHTVQHDVIAMVVRSLRAFPMLARTAPPLRDILKDRPNYELLAALAATKDDVAEEALMAILDDPVAHAVEKLSPAGWRDLLLAVERHERAGDLASWMDGWANHANPRLAVDVELNLRRLREPARGVMPDTGRPAVSLASGDHPREVLAYSRLSHEWVAPALDVVTVPDEAVELLPIAAIAPLLLEGADVLADASFQALLDVARAAGNAARIVEDRERSD